MTKYIVYAIDEEHPVLDGHNAYKPVKKFKRDYDAFGFIDDYKNLSRYGCMIVVKDTDNDGSFTWNEETKVWERTEA